MTPEKWNEVKEIFNEAVELPNNERAIFLADRIDGDEELRGEVEKLLAADEQAETSFDDLSFVSHKDFSASDKIGNYQILKKIGEGGMGAVYAAERSDLKQKVALKIIRHGANSEVILRRFRREQEILAALEHPNIARLLDVGSSENGTPFLAMEYVEGEDLIAFSRRNNLSVNEKLILFRKVCEAVSYAHSRLVVHRDLKPSNILVNEKSEPKLLDFGISKLISETESSEDKGTVTSLGMLTPNYASPEQFRGETVSTSTDLYSLGVILYELLTDALPYQITNKRIDEVARAVIETNPQKPSEAVSSQWSPVRKTDQNDRQATDKQQATTEKEQSRKPQIINRKSLRGDLDNIILKTLRKEPERRYASVEQFSEDLRRHLEGLPVTARADTFSYRAEKFIRRNRAAVAAGLIIFLTLLGGIAATSWQTVRAERQRALAEKRFNEVRQIANNVVFKYHDEIETVPGTTKVREILIKDAIEYLDRLAQDSADDISLKRELAKSYVRIGSLQSGIHGSAGIGEIADAIESDRKAVALLEEAAQKSDDPVILDELRSAYSDLGQIYNRAGDDKKTEYLQKALDLSEKLTQGEFANTQRKIRLAADYINLADITPDEDSQAINKGEVYFGNKQLYTRALEIIETILKTEPENDYALERKMQATSRLSASYQLAADAYKQRGEQQRKQEFAAQALNYIRQARGAAETLMRAEPENAVWQYNYSALLWNESLIESILGNGAEALKIQVEEIAKMEKVVEADPKDADARHGLAVMYDGHATTFTEIKNYDSATVFQQKALAIVNELVEQDSENLEFRQTRRDIMTHAAEIAEGRGNIEEAARTYQTAYRQYIETPMLQEKPAEAAYYEGLMKERIGNLYLKAAEAKASGIEKTRLNLKTAAANFQSALDFWKKPEVEVEFFRTNREQIEEVSRKISECAGKLAAL